MEKIRYHSLNEYLKKTFGRKVYKISIDAGFTCPNRDGKVGYGGCIFCSAGGSGEFAQSSKLPVTEQLELGKKRVEAKMPKDGAGAYIAYFQAFTNTYAPVCVLREKFMEAINHPEVVVLSIATRPDCLPDEVIELLSELNTIKPVWVELGLQTIHEDTAEFINRGYKLPVYDDAVMRLSKAGIKIVTHVILGLPGEDAGRMLETVKYVANTKTFGIKLQLLHIIRGTALDEYYERTKFALLTELEYSNIVRDAVALLPDDMIVHRITGDGDKKTLKAPLWSADKKHVLNTLSKVIEPYSH